MKLCEFYRNQFFKAQNTAKHFEADSEYIMRELGYEKGSFVWVKLMAERYFGGGYEPEYVTAGITREQLNAAKSAGYVKHTYSQSWIALKTNTTDWWGLTNKGLKALYETYKGKW